MVVVACHHSKIKQGSHRGMDQQRIMHRGYSFDSLLGNPGRYSGKMENGVPHGVGVMTYSSDGLIAESRWGGYRTTIEKRDIKENYFT